MPGWHQRELSPVGGQGMATNNNLTLKSPAGFTAIFRHDVASDRVELSTYDPSGLLLDRHTFNDVGEAKCAAFDMVHPPHEWVIPNAGKAIDITLADHVICGRAGSDPCGKGFFSFREAGIL
jgi:hypothetical protein